MKTEGTIIMKWILFAENESSGQGLLFMKICRCINRNSIQKIISKMMTGYGSPLSSTTESDKDVIRTTLTDEKDGHTEEITFTAIRLSALRHGIDHDSLYLSSSFPWEEQ